MDSNLADALSQFRALGPERMEQIGWTSFLAVELLSLASSLFVALLYVAFLGDRETGGRLHRAFPLIGVSVTTIFVAIQFSLPLSLGLLGALSIVRFRTPVKEPEEIGFILVVIAASLCCATFNLLLLGVFLAVGVIALVALEASRRLLGRKLSDGLVVVSLPNSDYDDVGERLFALVESALRRSRLDSIAQNESSATISFSFARLDDRSLVELATKIRKLADTASVNVFHARADQL